MAKINLANLTPDNNFLASQHQTRQYGYGQFGQAWKARHDRQQTARSGQWPKRCEGSFQYPPEHTFMATKPSHPQFETGLDVTAPNQVFCFTSPALTHRSCH